ncbi:MAG: protein phosphatase CheZ [Chromatiales bacterium]|nr:protein phosphatase CheZ [Chromatiales bacterium]
MTANDKKKSTVDDDELKELITSWKDDDEDRFLEAVDALSQRREFNGVAEQLSRDIESALEHFRSNARLDDLTNKQVPDARVSLEHVLDLTNEAAHRTMDLVERSYVPAERTRDLADRIGPLWQSNFADAKSDEELRAMIDEFLTASRSDAEEIRRNLGEVLMAQGYQDLSGQIIRSVIKLIDEIHHALGGIIDLSGGKTFAIPTQDQMVPPAQLQAELDALAESKPGVMGPRIPGVEQGDVVNDQDEIDKLLSGFNK